MITRAQKIRLGIFITTALTLFIIILAFLSLEKLFREKDIYYVAYTNTSVTGLDIGSSVKYLGINVGAVQDIQIDPRDISTIIVTIAIKKDTPIKKDVRADISTLGITGIKVIELRGGTQEASSIKPGEYITPGKSLTEDITGKAEKIAEKIEHVLNNLIALTAESNQDKIFHLVDEAIVTVDNLNMVIDTNKTKISHAFSNLDTTMRQLSIASKSSRATMQRLEKVVRSDSIRQTLANISQIADKLNRANIYNLDEQVNVAVQRMNTVLEQLDLLVRLNQVKFNQTMDDLNETVHYLNNAARQIDEDPSILLGGKKPENPPDDQLKD
jgi:phospholipid/cholesterol/gamma-HCH transport system substrate-binding protein